MSRSLVLLLSPRITVGLVYAFGIGAVIVYFVLALRTLMLSTGESEDGTVKGKGCDFAYKTATAAGL
ncbi:hypothetical protein [Variovorax sp. MHTC-1]|uniref:hypothetical protein n=1 Tax=Variovorax sp. MHTC-1 TaxID=2495593 RepID=UPI000F87E25C|nr:hypothetical protein [Variovorax sp. MHTC-1]RST47919.1 hypothetical protein EJI01_27445 [Variovorax sp. MHTC-1]